MFVKLTLADGNPIWLRARDIVGVLLDEGCSRVILSADTWRVSESPDEIMRLMRYADIER